MQIITKISFSICLKEHQDNVNNGKGGGILCFHCFKPLKKISNETKPKKTSKNYGYIKELVEQKNHHYLGLEKLLYAPEYTSRLLCCAPITATKCTITLDERRKQAPKGKIISHFPPQERPV